MKISFLLIILGFSQVLGQNYGSLTESKPKREDQLDNKIEVVNNNLEDSEDAPSELEHSVKGTPPQSKTECDVRGTTCSRGEDCKPCSECPNGSYCDLEWDLQYPGSGIHPCKCNEYYNSMDFFNAKSDKVQIENEGKIVELEENVNNNLEYAEAEPSELAQPKTECRKWFTFCSSNKDCNQCSDCPHGAYCELEYNTDSGRKTYSSCECFAQPQCDDSCFSDEDCEQCSNCSNGAYCDIPRDPGFNIGSFSCECLDDNYEYDNSMDYLNAKSDKVQSENEDKVIELGEMVSNNLEHSEAGPLELAQPETECGYYCEPSCSSDEDCKKCSNCPNGAYCDHEQCTDESGKIGYPTCLCSEDYLSPSQLAQWTTRCGVFEISCSMDEHCKECSDCPNGGYCDLEYINKYGKLGGACDCIEAGMTEGQKFWGGK